MSLPPNLDRIAIINDAMNSFSGAPVPSDAAPQTSGHGNIAMDNMTTKPRKKRKTPIPQKNTLLRYGIVTQKASP
jgi:hypothetical protein